MSELPSEREFTTFCGLGLTDNADGVGFGRPPTFPRPNLLSPLARLALSRPRRLGTRSEIQGGICAPAELPRANLFTPPA